MKDYPFVKCLDPQSIINPYNNERLLVECGKCQACRVRKGAIASMKCKLESLSHKYCIFVTLTYNRYAVPLMNVIPSHVEQYEYDGNETTYTPRTEYDKLVEFTPRLGIGTILGNCDSSESFIDELKVKTNTSGLIPHLSKRDAQLFIKRLRKYISKYETEKIRYFCAGEYGPVHFRPHLHLLLWFSSDKTYKIIRKAVHSSWSYGRVDVETSFGKSADYVAKYVNGSCSLPRILQQKETKPFALHSNHLGEMVLKKNREEIYRSSAQDVIQRSVPISNKVSDIRLWRSLTVTYFPRCKEYSLRTESERLQAYRAFHECREIYDTSVLTEQVDNILSDIVSIFEDIDCRLEINQKFYDLNRKYHMLDTDFDDVARRYNDEYYDLLSNVSSNYLTSRKGRIISYFLVSCKINPQDLYTRKSYEKCFRKVYMELRLSRHFIDFCCNSMMSEVYRMYKKIESFWNDLDYLNLVHQYQSMEEFCDSHYENEEDLQMFYSNVLHDMDYYKDSPYYKSMKWQTEINYENSVKHKKLNDLNNIFSDK